MKHLSTLRKRNQIRDYPSSGERTGNSLNLNHFLIEGSWDRNVGPEKLREQSGKSGETR